MNKSESIKSLAIDLAKAQQELSNPKKSSENPYFKSKYADLSEVINVSKPTLALHGISVLQFPSYDYDKAIVSVETMMLHSSGEWISEILSIKALKTDAQSIGSVITYARRYALAAICGIAQEDDDGEAAGSHEHPGRVDNSKTSNPLPVYEKRKVDANMEQWVEKVVDIKSQINKIKGIFTVTPEMEKYIVESFNTAKKAKQEILNEE